MHDSASRPYKQSDKSVHNIKYCIFSIPVSVILDLASLWIYFPHVRVGLSCLKLSRFSLLGFAPLKFTSISLAKVTIYSLNKRKCLQGIPVCLQDDLSCVPACKTVRAALLFVPFTSRYITFNKETFVKRFRMYPHLHRDASWNRNVHVSKMGRV